MLGVGKRVMSSPISAMIVCAARWPTPVISSSRSTAVSRVGSITVAVAVSLSAPLAVVAWVGAVACSPVGCAGGLRPGATRCGAVAGVVI